MAFERVLLGFSIFYVNFFKNICLVIDLFEILFFLL